MKVTFYKSLDREFEVLGVKGKWVRLVLIGIGTALILSFLFGSVLGTGIGIVIFFAATVLICFAAITFQVKLPSRQIDKALIAKKTIGWVIRRETLSRILLPDKDYLPLKEAERNGNPGPEG